MNQKLDVNKSNNNNIVSILINTIILWLKKNLIHKNIINNKKRQLYDKLKVYFMAPCKRTNSGYIFITLDFFFNVAFPPLKSRYDVFYSQNRSCNDGKGASHPHGSWPGASNVFESTYPRHENAIFIRLKTFIIVKFLRIYKEIYHFYFWAMCIHFFHAGSKNYLFCYSL